MKAKIQFTKGLDEPVLPNILLTRSQDGSTGTATFFFLKPNILNKNTIKQGEILGMYLIDKEGAIETRSLKLYFQDGKPESIECIYIIKNVNVWNRFLRFMKRYEKTNELVFTKAI